VFYAPRGKKPASVTVTLIGADWILSVTNLALPGHASPGATPSGTVEAVSAAGDPQQLQGRGGGGGGGGEFEAPGSRNLAERLDGNAAAVDRCHGLPLTVDYPRYSTSVAPAA
jgi:hypothetical protein